MGKGFVLWIIESCFFCSIILDKLFDLNYIIRVLLIG